MQEKKNKTRDTNPHIINNEAILRNKTEVNTLHYRVVCSDLLRFSLVNVHFSQYGQTKFTFETNKTERHDTLSSNQWKQKLIGKVRTHVQWLCRAPGDQENVSRWLNKKNNQRRVGFLPTALPLNLNLMRNKSY